MCCFGLVGQFLLGVAAVLMVRSGWTALSTSLAFALALTLMLTRRPGMTLLLRSAAAALLVPSLAVVVVCLGAQRSGEIRTACVAGSRPAEMGATPRT